MFRDTERRLARVFQICPTVALPWSQTMLMISNCASERGGSSGFGIRHLP